MQQPIFASDKLTVHYSRLDKNYPAWNLWVWNEEEKKPGFEVKPSGTDAFGAVYELDLAAAGLAGKRTGLLPRLGNWVDKDAPDRMLPAARPGELYLIEGDPAVYQAPPEISTRISGAYLDSPSDVRLTFSRPLDRAFVEKQGFYLTRGENAAQPVKVEPLGGAYSKAARLTFDSLGNPDYQALNAGKYEIHSRDFKPVKVALGEAVYGRAFASRAELGMTSTSGAAVLRIFAPSALKAEALVYDSPDAKPAVYPLERGEAGIWERNFGGPLDGKYYRLRVQQGAKTYEGLDPYARCVTGDAGKALIGAETTPVSPGPAFGLDETILYEVHLRDLTMDAFSGVKNKGKYLGAAEAGTRHPQFPEITTGLDHIAELGVNAVHILPFQDFENGDSTSAYNWGYMPVNFNSPEGAYASNPADQSRVREVKLLVDAFHRKGLKVIMDVVYNHTAETRDRVYNFNALAMDYYYRVNPDGSYSNGSGCGNEFRTEAPMARKFLIDSLLYWVREYKVDGFRFDLMGLIDVDAVAELVKALKAEKPDILVYGEPWTAGSSPTRGVRKGSQRSRGFSVFNDNFRDAIKGSVFSLADLGYVQAARNRDAVMKGIRGSVDDFTDGPLETLNYVSCHDNHTLWDRLDLSLKDETPANKALMDKLANALVLTSQGVPFLHAGEEFLRTKKGEENSYNLPDEINRLDWTRKKENIGVFEYYRDLTALRRAHPAFRMSTAAQVRENLKFYEELGLKAEPPSIAYMLYGGRVGDAWERIVVLINPEKQPRKFQLPMGKWLKVFGPEGLVKAPAVPVSGFFDAEPLSLTVLKL
jgi:pullulanase